MIRWIFQRNWLSISLLSLMIILFSSGIEILNFNYTGLFVSGAIFVATLFSRHFPWISLLAMLSAAFLLSSLSASPALQLLMLAASSMILGAFGDRAVRVANISVAMAISTYVGFTLGYSGVFVQQLFGVALASELARDNSLAVTFILSSLLFGFSITFGRLATLKFSHLGSPQDSAVSKITNERLRLEVAKQNERVEVARDLSELLVERVAAMVSVTEGGRFAIRADPTSATRVLERAHVAARDAQGELRRLYDYLNGSILSNLVPFRISDLGEVAVAYRDLGYNVAIEEQGESFDLNAGMELCVYKVVFEALANARKHSPIGTDISVNFLWVEDGLQILIKDNGIERANRDLEALGEIVEGYSVQNDLDSLISSFEGATMTALQDRAAIYQGRIETFSVPGVGFTLSAIFPNLRLLADEKE